MNYDMKQSGGRIQQLRIQQGYTQERFARELNIDRSNLSRIESGSRGCSLDLLIQFSELFNVSLDYLILGQVRMSQDDPQKRERLKKELDKAIKHLEAMKAYL